MRFAREVEELMRPYPGRPFKMEEVVRYATGGRRLDARQLQAARRAAHRVLQEYVTAGSIAAEPSEAGKGGFTIYRWKVRHGVAHE